VVQKLFGTVTGKRIAILGFAFKANTNDTRESPAIAVCLDLIAEGAHLAIYDPRVDPDQISADLHLLPRSENTQLTESDRGSWEPTPCPEVALQMADAVIILTEWDCFRDLDWPKLTVIMRQPCWIFDTRHIVDPSQPLSSKINYWSLGKSI
jgi:UDPglucose 6-dehydrogenase